MNTRGWTLLACLALAALLLPACQLAAPAAPTPFPAAAFTQAAETIIAGLTQNAPVATDTPVPQFPTLQPGATSTPAPTDTPEDTNTPIPTSTASPSLTALPATGTAETAATPGPTITSQPAVVLFEEDFSSEQGWHTEKNDRFSFQFKDGGYQISVNILKAAIWSIRDLDTPDVRLEVDATQTGGPEDGYYGLVCRHIDEDNYYTLVIGSNDAYGIAKMKDGDFEFIQEGTAQPGVIRAKGNTNRIRADCVGSTLTLYANGRQLAQAEDSDFDQGADGMLAGTRLKEGTEVLFDNFIIYQP